MKRLVFIPGIMGSTLFEGQTNKRWHSPKNKNLKRLKFDPALPNKISAGRPLENGVFFIHNFVKKARVYSPIMNFLSSIEKENEDYSYEEFGYDWRINIEDNRMKLDEFLSGFLGDEIIVIAHSMGGLLTHSYCQWAMGREDKPNITKVITLATPWHGSPDAYIAIMYGLEKRCFPDPEVIAEVAKTFPSVYQLLPSRQMLSTRKLLEKDKRQLRWAEIFNFLSEQGCNVKDAHILNKDLHDSLRNPWPEDIKHYHMIGHDHGTFESFRLSSFDEDYADVTDGDETVPVDYATPDPIYNTEVSHVRGTHLGVTQLQVVHNWIKNILFGFDYANTPGLTKNYTKRMNWVAQRIACPVEVAIEEEIDIFDEPVHAFTSHRVGDVTYVIYNDKVATELTIEPYDEGLTSLETISICGGKETVVKKYPSIEVEPASKATVKISFDTTGEPKTEVVSVANTGESFKVEGVIVPSQVDNPNEAPTTRCLLKEVSEKSGNKYFSHDGVIINFSAKGANDTTILETLYSINDGPQVRFKNNPTKLILGRDIVAGKNIVTYYSRDIYDNVEKIKSRDFSVESKIPEILTLIKLHPDFELNVEFQPYYHGLWDYSFVYKLNDSEEVQEYNKPLELRFKDVKKISVKATNKFETHSAWKTIDLDFTAITEFIWGIELNNTIGEVNEYFPQSPDDLVKVSIGSSEKELFEKLPRNAKNIVFDYDDVMYNIALIPKYDVYLDYHSEIINREQEEVQISFMVFDSEGNREKYLKPHVKYTYLPAKDATMDTQEATVSNDEKGLYSFTISVQSLPKEVNKIKFEFRDTASRISPLKIKEFKIQ